MPKGSISYPPKDIKIYLDGVGEVLSIEECIRRQRNGSPEFDRSMELGPRPISGNFDPNWETYIVPEGARLRIRQEGHEERFLDIPTRDSEIIVLYPVRMRQV